MIVSTNNAVIVQANAAYTKHKIEYTKEEVLSILRKEYPETVPDAFLEIMMPAFMLGIRAGIEGLGHTILNKKAE
jgi:hypothetical protein